MFREPSPLWNLVLGLVPGVAEGPKWPKPHFVMVEDTWASKLPSHLLLSGLVWPRDANGHV